MKYPIIVATWLFAVSCTPAFGPSAVRDYDLGAWQQAGRQVSVLERDLGPPTGIMRETVDGSTMTTYTWTYTRVVYNPLAWVPGINLIVLICCEFGRMESEGLSVTVGPDGRVLAVRRTG